MSKGTLVRWMGLIGSGAMLLQLGGCNIGDLAIRAAGAGAIVTGLVTLLGL